MNDERWPGTTPAAAALLEGAAVDRAPHMRAFLGELAGVGCVTAAPPAVRTDYVNIARPSGAAGRGRLASMHVRTGRVEFQSDSWDLATGAGLASSFDHLNAGNKASISLDSGEAVAAAVAVARAVLAGRRR